MAGRLASLYFDDTSIRLVVTKGRQIKKWAQLDLEPGLIESGVVTDEAEVAARIRRLFQSQKEPLRKVLVGMSGLYCQTRPAVFPQLPKGMLEEAVAREAKRVLTLAPEEIYQSWQTIAAPEGKSQILLEAVPRRTVDALLNALRQAGLKPSFLDLKPLALSRIVRETRAVLVDVQTAEFDLVIVAGGVPQPVRTIVFPQDAATWPEKIGVVQGELERTMAFHDSNNPESPLDASVPILASGVLVDEPEIRRDLSDRIGRPVEALPSPLHCPEGFPAGLYMVNIGLLARQVLPRNKTGGSTITLNALPAAYLPKPISLTNVLALPGIVVAIGLLAFLWLLVQSDATDIESTRSQLADANTTLTEKQEDRQVLQAGVSGLTTEVGELQLSHDLGTALLGSLESQGSAMSGDLVATIQYLPDSVGLTAISHSQGVLTINGRAPTAQEVLDYLDGLLTSGRFEEITITTMVRNPADEMDFTLVGSPQGGNDTASSIVVALGNLPGQTTLNNVGSADGKVTLAGVAPDATTVLSYLEDLRASGRFDDITVTSITDMPEGTTSFSMVLTTGD